MQSRAAVVLTGVGTGAALMYLLDPNKGGRRRALLRDRAVHAARISRDAIDATSRDVMQRTAGVVAQMRGSIAARPVDDSTLIARVRSILGRVVSHPHAVEVSAADGAVTLRGPILTAEVPALLRAVHNVRGVSSVVNELDEHESRGDVPALQGGTTPPGLRPDFLQEQWSPTTRFAAGTTGLALMMYCGNRRDVGAMLLGTLGFGLAVRALTNLDMSRLDVRPGALESSRTGQ